VLQPDFRVPVIALYQPALVQAGLRPAFSLARPGGVTGEQRFTVVHAGEYLSGPRSLPMQSSTPSFRRLIRSSSSEV
jgi:hypothetical protein